MGSQINLAFVLEVLHTPPGWSLPIKLKAQPCGDACLHGGCMQGFRLHLTCVYTATIHCYFKVPPAAVLFALVLFFTTELVTIWNCWPCKQAVHKLFITTYLELQMPVCIAQGAALGVGLWNEGIQKRDAGPVCLVPAAHSDKNLTGFRLGMLPWGERG